MIRRKLLSIAILNLVAIYLLILAGGIVRSTGSGMGCPDWPKCFGSYVPPTSEDDLPDDYMDIYLSKRLAKNERLAGMLEKVGYQDLAYKLRHENFIFQEQPFNVNKTWIEYINRLIGALLGVLLIGLVFSAFYHRKKSKSIFWVSVLSLILTIFQGWVGSIVVSSNLMPGLITFHMLMAILIMGLLIWVAFRTYELYKPRNSALRIENVRLWFFLIGAAIVIQVLQITFGTRVREVIDAFGYALGSSVSKSEWVAMIGDKFLLHRSFSWLVLIINATIVIKVWKSSWVPERMKWSAVALAVCLLIEIIAGIGMAYWGIPPFLQPLHLLMATLLFGIQVFLFLETKFAAK